MGVNAEKLESRNNQDSPKSLIQHQNISEPTEQNLILSKDKLTQRKNQDAHENSPRVKQLKALQQMADKSPQTEKLRNIQATAALNAAQKKRQIPVNLEHQKVKKGVSMPPVRKVDNEKSTYINKEAVKPEMDLEKKPELSHAIDSKKLIKSELDLNAAGAAHTGKDNTLGAEVDDSLLGKVDEFDVNNFKTEQGAANDAEGGALDLIDKGAEIIQKNALDKVEILKGLSFGLDKEASKTTTQGSYITGKVAKDKWVFSVTFKVNTQGDYSAEYMGSVIENPPELNLEGENAGFKLNFGSSVKHQANAADPSITSKGGNASFQIMGQEVLANWNQLDFNINEKKVISADFSEVGLNLNLSVGEAIKVENVVAVVKDLVISNNTLTHGDIPLSIASVNLFGVANFSDINGSIGQKTGVSAEGNFDVTAEGLAGAKGKVSVNKGPDDKVAKYNLENGAFNATILGQEASINGVSYDSLNPHEISAASSNLKLNFSAGNVLKVDALDATLTDAKLTENGFSYQDITVNIASINVMDIAEFSDIEGNVNAEGGFNGSGSFNVTLPGLGGGQGNVTIKKGVEDKTTQYTLEDGSFNAEMVGQKASVNGVSYDSVTNIFSIEEGELDVSIMGVDLNIVIQNPSFTKNNGFGFASATATIPELAFTDKAKMSNIVVNIVKDGAKYNYDGSSDFNLSGEINGASASADGNVGISKEGEKGTSLSFTNANVTLVIFGQSLEINNINYKDGEFNAEKAVAKIAPPFLKKNLQIAVNDLSINKDGYSMSKAELETQLEVDFGIIKGNLSKLALEKTSDNWIISGEGGLTAGGTDFFGHNIPKIEGLGALSHNFGDGKTKKELIGVSATLPDVEFPGSLFPGKIGGTAEIPVLPGLNVVVSAGMEGKVTVPGLQLSVNKKGDQVYLISAGTQEGKPALGEVKVFLSVGAGTGIPLIASVSVSLGAEGGIFVRLDFNASKEISMEKDENALSLNKNTMETSYSLAGDLSLAAFLEIKTSAFYFFSKSFKKELAKRSFGGFEVSNEENFKWITPSTPLQTNEDIESSIKDNLKVNLNFVEESIWTMAKFVDVSSGFLKGSRNRILVVDRALGHFDKVRGEKFPADIKFLALKTLETQVENYIKTTKGSSSRTKEVQTLKNQIQLALKSIRAKVDKKLIDA